MSAMIISAVLLLIVSVGGLTAFYSRFNALDSELKEHSAALADACVDVVLYKISQNPNYTGPDLNYPVGGDSCSILGIQNPGGSLRTFQVQGEYHTAYTNVLVTINFSTLAIVSWREVPHF